MPPFRHIHGTCSVRLPHRAACDRACLHTEHSCAGIYVPHRTPASSTHQRQHIVCRGVLQREAGAEVAAALHVRAVGVVRPHLHPQAGSHLKLILAMGGRLLQPAQGSSHGTQQHEQS